MKIEVTKDSSHRTIEFEVSQGAAPDLDVSQSWHRKPRSIRPDKGQLHIVDGEVRRIIVSGYLIKASGQPSDSVRDKWEWSRQPYRERERIENAPEWVRHIWNEAGLGMAAWSYPDREDPEQVQAL